MFDPFLRPFWGLLCRDHSHELVHSQSLLAAFNSDRSSKSSRLSKLEYFCYLFGLVLVRVLALMKNINDNALALIFKVPRKKIHSSWKSESILSSKIQDFLCQIVTAKEDKTIIAGRKKNQKHVLWSKDTSIFLNGLIIFLMVHDHRHTYTIS